jgi:hypothetical protein
VTIAHVGGLPAEELLLPLAGSAGAALLLARAWLASVARHRRPRPRFRRR